MLSVEVGEVQSSTHPQLLFFPVFSQNAVKVEFSRVAGFCHQLMLFLQSYMNYSGLSRGKREGTGSLVAFRNKFPIAESGSAH